MATRTLISIDLFFYAMCNKVYFNEGARIFVINYPQEKK